MTPVIEGLQAVTVHVTDLERARAFYSKVLGLEEDGPVPNAPRVVFKLPGTPTRLVMHIQGPDEGGREPGTVSGILFHCADPVAACAAIRQKGGTVSNEPWTTQRGGATIVRAVIADPDGNQFLLSSSV
jgi:predicted enzyme related to lactoylglutathione lyase